MYSGNSARMLSEASIASMLRVEEERKQASPLTVVFFLLVICVAYS
jgi:hypothetical protein